MIHSFICDFFKGSARKWHWGDEGPLFLSLAAALALSLIVNALCCNYIRKQNKTKKEGKRLFSVHQLFTDFVILMWPLFLRNSFYNFATNGLGGQRWSVCKFYKRQVDNLHTSVLIYCVVSLVCLHRQRSQCCTRHQTLLVGNLEEGPKSMKSVVTLRLGSLD